MGYAKRTNVPMMVKTAIEFLIAQSSDLKTAAEYAQISLYELRRARPAAGA
jgi:hypothetical protein